METDGSDGLPKLSLALRQNGDTNGSDPWHFNAADMYDLGQRFAKVAYEHLAKHSYTVQVGEGCTVDKATLLSNGEKVSFTYTLARGKLLDKVLLNGTDVTATAVNGGKVTLTPDANTAYLNTVEVVTKNATKYKLLLNMGAQGTIKRNISGNTLYEGETLTFTLSPNEGYAVDKVIANGAEVTADADGKYSIPIGALDLNLNITFKQGTPTGSEPPSGEQSGSQDGGDHLGLIIGCSAAGAVAIGGAIGVGVYVKKKKKG